MTVDTEAVLARRDLFPRGMVQPQSGYRFSLDSLLLASFVNPGRRHVGVDLGCGCGVVGLALLLRRPDLTMIGVDADPDAVDAARRNGTELHFPDQFQAETGDVQAWRPEAVVDFVVANPPYREHGRGRVSQDDGPAKARFEGEGDFAAFARCAAVALKTRGKFAFVHLPERLAEIMAALASVKLEPKRMRLVHGRADETARMVLMETVKAAGPGLKAEPPLVLHQGAGADTRLTDEALAFCPFLACNERQGGADA